VVIDPDSPRRHRKLSAIMMADVSGFSRMMGSDEEATVDLIQDFHRRVALLVEDSEGRVVDTAGDSVFGEFDSVLNAVRCACRIQEEQALVNANRDAGRRVETRIGIHLGERQRGGAGGQEAIRRCAGHAETHGGGEMDNGQRRDRLLAGECGG
jgi:class 3 adenylate cyclase